MIYNLPFNEEKRKGCYKKNIIISLIKNTKKPRLHKSWMCNKLCHFGKTTFDNTNVTPITEYRDGQTCSVGQTMTKCEQVKHDLDLYGIDTTMNLYKHPKHSIGLYKAPGTV